MSLFTRATRPIHRNLLVWGLLLLLPILSACGGRPPAPAAASRTADTPANGAALYASHCANCHGAQAEGRTHVGPALVGNPFVDTRSDDELLAFLQVGRPVNDPTNRSGIPMPPRGGAKLDDDQLHAIIDWLRSRVR